MTTHAKATRPIIQFAAISFLAVGLFTLSGCLINSNTNEYETGTHISQTTLARIEPGTTTQDWVRSVLGEPSRTDSFHPQDSEKHGEIWVYEWKKTRSSSGSIIFLIDTTSNKQQHETYYIEFIDGIVSRTWADNS